MTASRRTSDTLLFCLVSITAGLIFAVGAARAQDALPPQPADLLLARVDSARGSAAAWSGVEALRAEGTLAINGREHTFTMTRTRSDQLRVDLVYRNDTQTILIGGDHGENVLPEGRRQAMERSEIQARLVWADLYLRFPGFWRRYPRRDLGPIRDQEGRRVQEITLWPKAGYPIELLIDLETHRIVGGLRPYLAPEQDFVNEARLYYYEFREVPPGLLFPFYVEFDEGNHLQVLDLRRVDALLVVPEEAFVAP